MAKPEPYIHRHEDLGKFQLLLIKACPPDRSTGLKSIPRLAMLLGITNAAAYYWIEKGRIKAGRAKQIVKLSKGTLVTFDDFIPFLS